MLALNSPAEVRVYDSEGQVAGVVKGDVKEEIPFSSYDRKLQTVVIAFSYGSYRYQVVGTGAGKYGLETVFVEGGTEIEFNATNIPILEGSVHQYVVDWDALARGEEGATLQVDNDGDGIFERTVTSDGTLTGEDLGVIPTEEFITHGPNPVSSEGCVFWLDLPEGVTQAELMIFNVTGRLLFETPLDVNSTRFPTTGTWNPVDNNGVELANGPYVYVLITDGKVIGQGKMVIQR